jgi:hypothetical protein
MPSKKRQEAELLFACSFLGLDTEERGSTFPQNGAEFPMDYQVPQTLISERQIQEMYLLIHVFCLLTDKKLR